MESKEPEVKIIVQARVFPLAFHDHGQIDSFILHADSIMNMQSNCEDSYEDNYISNKSDFYLSSFHIINLYLETIWFSNVHNVFV